MKNVAAFFASAICLATNAYAAPAPVCPPGPARVREAPPPGLRLRTHVRPGDHAWIGPDVPPFVPPAVGSMHLDLLDRSSNAWIALYRESFDACGAGTPGSRNCGAEVLVFDCAGGPIAKIPLLPLLSRRDQLEVQDVRYDGGVLYFNEACQTYAREAGGRCSSLVAFDPAAGRVLWRTPPLVSNNGFVVAGDYLVAAYGFTGERASIHLVRRDDGAVVDTKPLRHTNFEMYLEADTVGVDLWYDIGRVHYELSGLETRHARLVPLKT